MHDKSHHVRIILILLILIKRFDCLPNSKINLKLSEWVLYWKTKKKEDEEEEVKRRKMTDNSNGKVYVEHDSNSKRAHKDETTLYVILRRLISSIFFPDNTTSAASTPLLHRIKASFAENAPLLPEASRNTATNVLQWTRRGSPLRALLVISVSTFFSLISLLGFY